MADALRTWASCARRVGQLPHHFSVQVVGPCGQGGWVTRTLPPFVLRDRHWGTCCSFGRPSIELNLIRRPSAPLKLLFLKELVILKELVRLGVTASGALQAHMQRNGSRLSRPQRSLMALWLGLTGLGNPARYPRRMRDFRISNASRPGQRLSVRNCTRDTVELEKMKRVEPASNVSIGDCFMHTQIVMDRNGDTRHEFDPDDVVSCARAEEHFSKLTAEGFRAVALGRN